MVTTLEAAVERGRFGVGVTTLDLVDRSRPTEPNGEFPGSDQRNLTVELWYPSAPSDEPEARDAPIDRSGAPYPLIVFAHGFSGTRRQSVSYTQHLASHGYIVAAPDFPLSNLGAPGGPRLRAVLDQPQDVSFVIDSLLVLGHEEDRILADAIDADAIGLTGHSLGALTTLITTYGPQRDPRLKAALPITSPGCLVGEDIVGDTSVPILALGGSLDLLTPPAGNRNVYESANPPRYFVELQGANHVHFADAALDDPEILSLDFVGLRRPEVASDAAEIISEIGGDIGGCAAPADGNREGLLSPERQRELLRAFATPFFDAYLRGSDASRKFLEEELPSQVPEARFEFDLE